MAPRRPTAADGRKCCRPPRLPGCSVPHHRLSPSRVGAEGMRAEGGVLWLDCVVECEYWVSQSCQDANSLGNETGRYPV